jgi:hypothetical protein
MPVGLEVMTGPERPVALTVRVALVVVALETDTLRSTFV